MLLSCWARQRALDLSSLLAEQPHCKLSFANCQVHEFRVKKFVDFKIIWTAKLNVLFITDAAFISNKVGQLGVFALLKVYIFSILSTLLFGQIKQANSIIQIWTNFVGISRNYVKTWAYDSQSTCCYSECEIIIYIFWINESVDYIKNHRIILSQFT